MTSGGDGQTALLQAIWSPQAGGHAAVPGLRALPTQTADAGFSAYREHAKALSVKALGQTFPHLQSHLGEADFAGLAWAFARSHPPTVGDAAAWGEFMPAFLASLTGMDALPPELATLDWALHRVAGIADDAEPDPSLWGVLQSGDPATVKLHLTQTLTLWHLPSLFAQAEAGAAPTFSVSDGRRAWMAVWREGWQPKCDWLPADQVIFWQQLASGTGFGEALDVALSAHPELDLAGALGTAWQRGWLLGAHEQA